MDDSLFHAGERWVQERTGERATALINSRNVGPRIPAAARRFIEQQHWCVLGAADASGAIFAAIVAGEPGFVRSNEALDRLQITLDDPECRLPFTAPLPDLQAGQSVAALLIELQTRRRLRVNARLASTDPAGLELSVEQAFPVCPRYIQKREPQPLPHAPATTESRVAQGATLSEAAARWIDQTDTAFVASLGPDAAADVSHRGGMPGFIRRSGQLLRIPDFNGNSMFNTLGNLKVDARFGLTLPDFEGARQLQLTGSAQAHFNREEDRERTGGTGRWIDFTVTAWRITPLNRSLRWKFVEASPFNP